MHAASFRAACLFAALLVVHAHDDQRYDVDEHIPLFVDTVSPFNNPQETYRYHTLRYCKLDPLHPKSQSLGEILQGSEKVYSMYLVRFTQNTPRRTLCKAKLSRHDVDAFVTAIANQYQFHMYFDEIPLKGPVGNIRVKGDQEEYILYTNIDFKFEYNRDRVIDAVAHVSDTTGNFAVLGQNTEEVEFTYSVTWTDSLVEFEDRPANLPNLEEEPIDIQWFGICNSVVMVILLVGFLFAIVMRILKKDVQRITERTDKGMVETITRDGPLKEDEDIGWKNLQGDVFRFPPYKCIFSSLIGTGVQILLLFLIMLTLSVIGVFHQHGRGTMYAAIIIVYSLTAVIAGYVSASMYAKLEGENWVKNVMTTCTIFAVPVFAIWSAMNTIAWRYGSTVALPFGTIIALFALYLLVAFPLTLAGGIAGKNYTPRIDFPCKTKLAPREIPELKWWLRPQINFVIAGFLPFSAIYVELYYVFLSLWGHELFTPYDILYLVFIILLCVTIAITISLTFLQLTHQNHKWWWFSVMCGGSVAFFVYIYCFYFLAHDSQMYGFLQVSYYYGYMFIICYALFLMLGSVSFLGTLCFVKHIYSVVKVD